jgi:hypothetical protein
VRLGHGTEQTGQRLATPSTVRLAGGACEVCLVDQNPYEIAASDARADASVPALEGADTRLRAALTWGETNLPRMFHVACGVASRKSV